MRALSALFIMALAGLGGFSAHAQRASSARAELRIDTLFLYDSIATPEQVVLKGMSFRDLESRGKISPGDFDRLRNVFQTAYGWSTPEQYPSDPTLIPARTLDESLALVRRAGQTMQIEQRLALMSALVEQAAVGYDYSMTAPQDVPMEQIWQNTRMQEFAGGACGNLHAFGALYAEALGFQDAGSNTALQIWDGDGQAAAGHVVLHYKDPVTGQYYLQNYDRIIATPATTLPAFLEYADRLAGAFDTTIMTQELRADGQVRTHVFQPRVSRWIEGLLEDVSSRESTDAATLASVKLHFGNREELVRVSLQRTIGDFDVKPFALHAGFESDTGTVSFNVVGAAFGMQKTAPGRGLELRFTGGIQSLATPSIDPAASEPGVRRTSLVGDVGARAHAEKGKYTGALTFQALSTDYAPPVTATFGAGLSAPAHDIAASGAVAVSKQLSIEVSRHWEVTANDLQRQRPVMQNAFDRIDLVVDTRRSGRRAYVRSSTQVYLFEGIENLSALGIRQVVQAVFPSARFGEFVVVGDGSRFLSNRVSDPFYRGPAWGEARLSWEKPIGSNRLKIGAGGSWATGGNPFFRFQDPARVTPDIQGDSRRGRRIGVWMKAGWGK